MYVLQADVFLCHILACFTTERMSFEHTYVCLSKFLRFSSIFPSRFCCTVFLDCVCVPYWPELGKRPHCRDNVTRFSGQKIVMVTAILLYYLWLLNLDTETLIFFEFFLVPETLWRCLVVAKVKYCRVPSSAYCYTISHMKIARLLKYVLNNVIDMLIH